VSNRRRQELGRGCVDACREYVEGLACGLYTPDIMVSLSGGGGGAGLASPAGILVLLVVIAIIGGVYWLFNR